MENWNIVMFSIWVYLRTRYTPQMDPNGHINKIMMNIDE
jgi:hypothetical protein